MFMHVTSAQYIPPYNIAVAFNNGRSGIVNCEPLLKGEIFEELKDIEQFKKLYYNPMLKTVCWPNGADFAPEFLHDHLADM